MVPREVVVRTLHALVAGIGLVAVGALIAQAKEAPGRVEAGNFRLLDERGAVRAELRLVADSPVLAFLRADGSLQAVVGLGPDGKLITRDVDSNTPPRRDAPTAEPPKPAERVSRVLIEQSGSGGKTTSEFDAPRKWLLTWTNMARDTNYRSMSIFLVQEGTPVEALVMSSSSATDQTYVYKSGRFALQVLGTGDWTVRAVAVE